MKKHMKTLSQLSKMTNLTLQILRHIKKRLDSAVKIHKNCATCHGLLQTKYVFQASIEFKQFKWVLHVKNKETHKKKFYCLGKAACISDRNGCVVNSTFIKYCC